MSAAAGMARSAEAPLRGVIDLRAFAADPAQGTPTGETGDAWFAARRMAPMPEGPVSLAVADWAGEGRVDALPADEFVFVLSGTLTVRGNETLTLAADRGAMLPGGCGFAWRATPGTRAIVMRCAGGAPGAAAPIAIDLAATLAPSNPPAADLLLSPAPACRNHTDYRSDDGEFSAGVWASTPYHRTTIAYAHAELMHLLEGSVTFGDDAGGSRTFRKDDLFVVVPGARCSWLSEEDCAKLWVIYRPAA